MSHSKQPTPRLLALLFALFLGIGTTWAFNFSAVCSTGQTLYYTITDATNHCVSVVAPASNDASGWNNFTKPTGALDIPATVVDGNVTYTVTSIETYAFYGCNDLTSVTIPEDIISINGYAFWNCPALQTVYFNAINCTSMQTSYNSNAYSVFSSNASGAASALTRVVIGSSVTRIPNYAFKGSEDIYQRLVIPASVTEIGHYAFYNCNSMVQMVIQGNGLQTIGDYAFYGCSVLANALNLPNSVTTVGQHAFYGCSVLPSVTIGTGLTTIGGYAFWNCPNLTTVNFNATNCTTMFTRTGTSSSGFQYWSVFDSGTSNMIATPIETLNIGSNVTKIPDCAFRNSTNLTSNIAIPNATTYIGTYAFYGAKSTTLTIGTGVTSIGEYAFWECPNLATVNFNATNCTSMYTRTGTNSSNYQYRSVFDSGVSNTVATPIVTLNIGSDVTRIPNYAFCYSTNLTSNIVIPDATTYIGTYAFYGAKSTMLTIGTGVNSIGEYAFWECPNLATVNFNATNCSSMYTSSNSTNYSVFGANPAITTLSIGSNVTQIPDYAFRNCSYITGNLALPSVLNTIGQYAFYGCTHFTGNLTIPNSVTTLGQHAFCNCSRFNGNLTLPNNSSITEIKQFTFYGCSGLNGTLTIPENIEEIASSAFRGCSGFTGALILHDGMTTIGESAFYGCSQISSLTIGTDITSIGGYAFWDCPNLAMVNFNATNCTTMMTTTTSSTSCSVFNSGTSSINGGVTPIITLTIGSNVTKIPDYAFRNSSNQVNNLVIPGNVTSIGKYAFAGSSGASRTLLLGDALTSIDEYAFQGCSGFTGDLVIPNSVTTLNQYAFQGCSGFNGSLIIGSGVTIINKNTFADCSGFLGSLIVGRQVNSVGNYAFRNCSGFSNVISENPTPPTAVNNSFQSMNFSIPLYVPYAMTPAYQSAAGWSQFTNRVEQRVFDQLDNDLWSDVNNWYAFALPGANDVVCVNSDCHMDMNANVLHLYVLNLNDVLTINSGKNLTTTYGVGTLQASQLVVADGGSLYNPISNAYGTVKKQITGYGTGDGGWYTIASPIYGGTSVSGLTTGTYDLYVYDEAEAYWDNQKVSSNNITSLNSAQGYLYANSADKTLSMAGQLNASNADFSIAVTHQNGTLPGFNLVGNPYTNNISIGSVKLNNTPFTTYYKVANGNQLIASTSATPIKPAEGFMVQVSTSGTLTFNATGRERQGHYVQLTLRQGDQLSDRAYLSMEGGESLNKAVMAGHPSLLYLVSEGRPLAVAPHRTQAYSLVLDAVENGVFTIEAEQLGTDCNYLHLLDRLTGEDFDLLSSSYTFEAAPTDRTDRFVLLLAEGAQPELFDINRTRDMIPVLPPHGSGNDEPAYPQTSYDITVTADPANGGTVSGAGPYLEGASCTLTATANPGYTFTNWTKNGTQVSTNATYTFTVTENADFVAHFTANNYNITATANPTGGGTVNGGGSYNYGSTCTLTALPATGYTFSNWSQNGTPVSTNATFSFTVTGDASFVAHFTANSYNIIATANPTGGGTVNGGGSYNYGSTCTLTALPATGYTFSNWSQNGTPVSTNATFSFTVTGDASFVAHFTANSYNIIATANPTGGGTVNGGGSYNYGTTCTLMANANAGYTFVNWTENDNPVSTDIAYSFTVTGPRTLSANFSLNSYSITVAADPVEGGTITGAGTYAHGANVTLTATANTGYTFVNWTKDGIQVSTSPTYSFSVTEPGAYAAHFSLNSFEVLVEAHPEEGGTVTGGGTYDYGETATLTATANEGYTFDHWSEGYEFQYFTIESLEDGNTITFSKPATITASDLTSMSYSTDNGVTWTTLTNDGSSAQSIDVSLDKGDKAIWKGVAKRLNNNYGQQHGCHFTSTAEKEWEVSGNIMSLLYEDDFYGRDYPGGGYNLTFYGLFCTMTSTDYWLKSAKNLVLPAAVLKTHCYTMMFKNNTGLVFPPRVLPAEVATSTCYYQMFYGCTSLVDTPEIMATSCEGQQNFYGMFMNCTSLTRAPELRITNTTSQCCLSMFNGCSNLTDALELPATTMYYQCYKDMFHGCTALTAAPALPATSLATGCYQQMFVGCSSLTIAPVLSASTLASYSYNYMFSGCTALNEITCLATDITAEQCTVGWLNGVSSTGTFHKAAEMTGWATGTSGIPTNWTVEDITTDYQTPFEEQYFTIESLEDGNTITLTIPAVITTSYMTSVSYSTDNGATWNTTDIDGTAKTITVSLANSGDKVLFKGLGRTLTYGNSHDNEQSYFSSSKQYIVYGNIASLLYGDDFEDKTQFPNNSARTYQGLFAYSDELISAQNLVLPYTILAGHCYRDMFTSCDGLTQAPQLPATTLNNDCYMNMFSWCTALTHAPELPATTLASECYNQMFRGCSSLTHAPELPAQTLAYMCYYLMFHSCSSLAQAPNLPAATLVNKCYQSMFYGCSSLNEVTCLATDISATDCTASWLNGVASTGTFHKASGMNNWPAGVSGIPSGWTVFEEAPADPTEPSFSYTVTDDRYWLAHFILNSYEVTASVSPVEGGTVTGEGTYNHFESCTLTATANEGYTFVNWTENDAEVSTDATYIFTVTGPRTLVANFNPIIATQTFELVQGWNWWAPTVKVTAAQLQDSIGNSLVQIKAEEGAVGDNIEPGEMYRIQTSAPCEVSLAGLSITPVEVSLAPGANWFGSICVEEKPIAAAISVEATAGDKIVSQNGGFAIYNGTVWEGTLTTLQPGCGYVYVTTESKTLIVDAVGINEPTVTTSQVTNVTQTTATCGGNVTDDGGGQVTERGICWGTSQNPTISGSHVSSGTGTGSYTVNMTGLTANTTYYVRAYATNSAGTAYGSEVRFTTSQIVTVPTVTTSQVTNVTQTTATCGGNVTATGNATVTERGICWGTSQNPTTSGSHGSSGTGTGSYTVNMTGLTANTTYYVRAYATNSAGTAYGSEVSFTTSQIVTVPTVTTSQVTNITQTTATCGGNVTATGNATVTARGVCWSTSQNPTVTGSHTTNGTGTGSFTSSITDLSPNTTYYVRAYATNSAGTAYGTQRSFTTTQNITQLTVFDGTATDEGVPVVGWVLNQYTKCEYVMPASYLSSMIGKTITSMACYSNNTSVNYAATFKVFIKEVSFSTISSFQGYSGATTVYEGSLTVANGMLTIEFTTPFTYNGGNLLIGFYNISPGTTQLSNKRFYGVTATDSSVVGWNPNSLNNITSPAFPNFLPKTTFYFSN